jgi:hypothetical protein
MVLHERATYIGSIVIRVPTINFPFFSLLNKKADGLMSKTIRKEKKTQTKSILLTKTDEEKSSEVSSIISSL